MNLSGVDRFGKALGGIVPRRAAIIRTGSGGILAAVLSAIGSQSKTVSAQPPACRSQFIAYNNDSSFLVEGIMTIAFDSTGVRTEGILEILTSELTLVSFEEEAQVVVFSQYTGLSIGMIIDVYEEEMPNTFAVFGAADETLEACEGTASGTFVITTGSSEVITGVWRLVTEGLA